MRFQLGPVPMDEAFDPEAQGWNRVREPRPGVLMVSAIPLGMLAALPFVWLWSLILTVPAAVGDGSGVSFTVTLPQFVGFVAVIIGGVLLHEALHAVPLVIAGRSEDLIVGFWSRHLVPYVAFMSALPLRTQLLSGILPLPVLSGLPLLAALVLPSAAWWLALLSVVNVLGSGADLIMLQLLIRQVPRQAIIRNQGFATWWRTA